MSLCAEWFWEAFAGRVELLKKGLIRMSIEELVKNTDFPAPRLTEDMVIDNIENESYYVWPGTTVTSCLLTLKNGYGVVGVSACAHAGNFNIVLGQELARKDAIRQIWPLMGYELRSHLHAIERPNAPNPHVAPSVFDGPPVMAASGPVQAAIAETAASLAEAGVITTDEAARVTPTEGAS
jgi:hypothetical protein